MEAPPTPAPPPDQAAAAFDRAHHLVRGWRGAQHLDSKLRLPLALQRISIQMRLNMLDAAFKVVDEAEMFVRNHETSGERKTYGLWKLGLSRADLLNKAGRLPEAVHSYRAALEVRPDNGLTWVHLANALEAVGKLQACGRSLLGRLASSQPVTRSDCPSFPSLSRVRTRVSTPPNPHAPLAHARPLRRRVPLRHWTRALP